MTANENNITLPTQGDHENLSERLEFVRKAIGVKQLEFASIMDVSLSAYKRYLTGTPPNFDSLIHLYHHEPTKPYYWWLITGDNQTQASSEEMMMLIEKSIGFVHSIGWIEITDNASIEGIAGIIHKAIYARTNPPR